MAYYAHPDKASSIGAVIFPGAGGLREFFTDFAVRLAEAGIHAVAIDYYGRTAPLEKRGPNAEDFDFKPHYAELDYENVDADGRTAIEWLTSLPGLNLTSVYAIGFCIGGGLAWRQSATEEFSGSIGLYGIPAAAEDRISGIKRPVLILAGGADTAVPVDSIRVFSSKLESNGVFVETHIYPNAPHNFFHMMAADFEDECKDAWQRILSFTGASSGPELQAST